MLGKWKYIQNIWNFLARLNNKNIEPQTKKIVYNTTIYPEYKENYGIQVGPLKWKSISRLQIKEAVESPSSNFQLLFTVILAVDFCFQSNIIHVEGRPIFDI